MKESLVSAIIVSVASYMEMERAGQPAVVQTSEVQPNARRRRELQELAWQQSMPVRFRHGKSGK